MKLAEALILRSDYRKKLESLRDRLTRVARIQEGDTAPEQPEELLDQATRITSSLADLIFSINQANFNTILQDGQRLTQMLAQRDVLAIRHSILQHTMNHATGGTERYSSREIRWLTNVSIAELQGRIDDLGRQIREMNCLIQATNWQVDV